MGREETTMGKKDRERGSAVGKCVRYYIADNIAVLRTEWHYK